MFVHERMTELRDAAGYTQEEFRCLVDISSKKYYKIEKGQQAPSCRELVRIARALNVSTDYLLGMDIPVPPEIPEHDSPDDNFRIRFNRLLTESGDSVDDIAEATGKSVSTVNAWKGGRSKPDAMTLVTLAGHFSCTTDYLLGVSMLREPVAPGYGEPFYAVDMSRPLAEKLQSAV